MRPCPRNLRRRIRGCWSGASPWSPAILDFAPASREDVSDTGRLVSQQGARWRPHVVDQRDINALREAADSIAEQWGGVDIVFANAGIQAFKPLLEMADADWHDQIDVNLTSTRRRYRRPLVRARR